MTIAKRTKPVNPEFADAVGQSSLCRIDWKDWKKEQPKNCAEIYVVVKVTEGYHVTNGYYLDQTIPANGPFKKSRWRSVRFHDMGMCEIFLDSDQEKYLVAWGYLKPIIRMGRECSICKRLDCIC